MDRHKFYTTLIGLSFLLYFASHNFIILFQLQYQFQYVFDEYTSQKAVYDYVAMPLMEDLIKGKNGKDNVK